MRANSKIIRSTSPTARRANTIRFNQTLFRDCAEDCGACQNKECLEAKNAAYVLARCIELAQADPYLQLAINDHSNLKVVEALSEKGYELTELDIPEWKMEQEPQMPERPVLGREDYEDDDDFANEQEWYNQNYERELQEYNETVEHLKCEVAEGRIWKYALIGYSSIGIFYRIMPINLRKITIPQPKSAQNCKLRPPSWKQRTTATGRSVTNILRVI